MEWKESNMIVDDDEMAYVSDAKFKQFGTAVDKALKSFEYSTEWADLISCLGKLNKVILTYSTFHVIPRKILVGKRLAQCLHPALPSGVHLKALETYNLVLKQIGQSRLTKDLFIYSAGLFPLLAAAAISVKPVLLDLYEEFYVPLGPHLIPGLPGFLIAVLPGIEEGSEFNDRTTSILEAVCHNSQKESFFSSLWGCILHSAQIRLPAVTFAVNHLAKHSDDTDKKYVFGNDLHLMVDGICSALEDHNVLVQRMMLDFLLAFVPLENRDLSTTDIVSILVCCLNVVLRRDMSLNRRLYQWILGTANEKFTEDSNRKSSMGDSSFMNDEHAASSSFEKVTKKYVIAAVISLFKSISGPQLSLRHLKIGETRNEKLKPFRVLVSLLDKPEIGPAILEDVLIEVFRALYRECSSVVKGEERAKEHRNVKDEIVKTANNLFNALESYFIWEYLERGLCHSFQSDESSNAVPNGPTENIFEELEMQLSQPDCAELFTLIDFLLDIVSVEAAVETQTVHWPSLLNCIIAQMTDNLASMKVKEIYQGIRLASKLLSRISPDIKSPTPSRRKRLSDKSSHGDNEMGSEHNVEFDNGKSMVLQGRAEEANAMYTSIQRSTQFFDAFVTQSILGYRKQISTKRTVLADEPREEEEDGHAILASTFAASCRYLVEIACFPCWKPVLIVEESDGKALSNWLRSLIACISQTESIDIQTVAMGTLLDLVNINLCVFPSSNGHQRAESVASVIPLISQTDFIILDQSQVYKDMALILWNEIRPDNCQVHSACSDLFLRLHNISPSALLCEDVVSNTMVAQSLELRRRAHWKFAVLWHLSRDFYKNESSKSSRGGNRSLDRCMLLMLDSLQSNDPVIAKCSEQWLQHAIHCGDIGRIIEPLLITMLNPTSRRISIHFAALWDTAVRDTEADTVSHDLLSDSEHDQLYQRGGDGSEENSSNDFSDVRRSASEQSDSVSNEQRSISQPEQSDEGLKIEHIEEDVAKGKKAMLFDEGKEDSAKSTEKTQYKEGLKEQFKSVNALDVHKLFYTQLYDTTQTMYALKTALSILDANGKAFVFSSARASMNMCGTVHQIGLRELLIRHRRALTGKDFYGSLADSQQLLIKASTAKYMEIILSICLYFIRSEYHPSIDASESDLEDNFRVRVWSLRVMTKVLSVLLELLAEGDVAFSNFVSDLFDRCKVQRIALHCLLSSVYNFSVEGQEKSGKSIGTEQRNFVSGCCSTGSERSSEMQRHCLQFIKKLVFLEERIGYGKTGSSEKKMRKFSRDKKSKSQQKSFQFEFVVGVPIVSQPMFLCVLLSALKEETWNSNHDDWIKTVMEILPKCGISLPTIVIPVVDQIFLTMKNTTVLFFQAMSGKLQQRNLRLPIDYFLKILENVTEICHHCLIEKDTSYTSIKSKADTQRSEIPSSIFDSLIHVFSSQSSPNRTTTTEEVNEPWMETKQGLLSILPAMLSSIVIAWNVWNQASSRASTFKMVAESPLPIGQPKSIRQAILQLLTPVAIQHTPVFLAAVADVWNSSKRTQVGIEFGKIPDEDETSISEEKAWILSIKQKSLPAVTSLQESLLEMILSIKVLSVDKIIDSAKHILRQTMSGKDRNISGNQPLEVNLLQFIHAYLQRTPKDQIFSIKSILMSFLRDGMNFNASPQTLFVLVSIYYLFVSQIQCPDDKRSRKELQDLAIKFFEAMNTIAGASLENSTWFRRNVAVLPNVDHCENKDSVTNGGPMPSPPPTASLQPRNSQYSINALCFMAEILAPMLDLLYISEEKDKITSFLFYVMYNVTPYLKNHSVQNVANFRASSALLASITDYQYTLRSWKKDVHELFLEGEFFKMDHVSLRFWRCIIDHLLTYDSTTFRDLVARINMTQSGAINIFANREQEIEQRASLLKRLSFAIFCGETDQYHNYMPDIQERLVESLRQIQAPLLYQQVFFCFRILILRMSPHHLTSLWPHLITELVTVFLRIERELISADNQRSKNSILGTIESFFTSNGLTTSKEKWLLLYLEACKLLDLFFSLECDDVPHFQSYRWAFIDTPGVEYDYLENMKAHFVIPDSNSIHKEKLKASVNAGKERLQDKAVSKLSVMNAPLSSKLRKNDKKAHRGKTNVEKKSEPNLLMKFAPYLSRLTILLSQRCEDASSTHQKSAQITKNEGGQNDTDIHSAERRANSPSSCSKADSNGENAPPEGVNSIRQVSTQLYCKARSSGDSASNACNSDTSKTIYHPLELMKIESIFELLPFLESVSNLKRKQVGMIEKEKLEELTEKDFKENLFDKSK